MACYKSNNNNDVPSLSTSSVFSVSPPLNGSYRRHSTNEQLKSPSAGVALRRVSSFTSANTLAHKTPPFPVAEKFTGKFKYFLLLKNFFDKNFNRYQKIIFKIF